LAKWPFVIRKSYCITSCSRYRPYTSACTTVYCTCRPRLAYKYKRGVEGGRGFLWA